jgi:hypothetical protein
LRAVDTDPLTGSITPGEPTPIPISSCVSRWAAPAASRTTPIIWAMTSSGPPAVGVGRRACPSTLLRASTIAASIFVPPRSIPPRAARGLLALGMRGSFQVAPGAYSPVRIGGQK